MWMLYVVTLLHGGVQVEWFGGYDTHEKCMYELQELEIGVNLPNQGMLCLLDPIGSFGQIY